MLAFAFAVILVGESNPALVAVTDARERRSWTPKGKLLPKFVIPDLFLNERWNDKSDPWVYLVVKYSGAIHSPMPSFAFKFPGSDQTSSAFTMLQKDKQTWLAGIDCKVKTDRRVVDIKFGLSDAPWKTVRRVRYPSGKGRGVAFNPLISQMEVPADSSNSRPTVVVRFRIPAQFAENAVELVARDKHHNLMDPAGSLRDPRSKGFTKVFFTGRTTDLGSLELRTRRYRWTTVRDIHLTPTL